VSAPHHTIAEAVEAFDDEALLKMMRHQLVSTFPAFDENPRVKAARDRLIREVEAIPDALATLRALEAVVSLDFSPMREKALVQTAFAARAALAKARGE